MEGLLLLCDYDRQYAPMRLDMISPHFCTKYQCSRKAAPALPVILAYHADQGTAV